MMRIAIVDDSATARMFVRRCLAIIGLAEAEFVELANGQEALACIRELPVDLLVTDLTMPLMDGETLLKWMKANPKLCSVPVLVITSAGNPAKEAELTARGALAVLAKPITPAGLMKALAHLVPATEDDHGP
ncbi:MAG: response regulator [Thermodesulfobacteriota bacterium]